MGWNVLLGCVFALMLGGVRQSDCDVGSNRRLDFLRLVEKRGLCTPTGTLCVASDLGRHGWFDPLFSYSAFLEVVFGLFLCFRQCAGVGRISNMYAGLCLGSRYRRAVRW